LREAATSGQARARHQNKRLLMVSTSDSCEDEEAINLASSVVTAVEDEADIDTTVNVVAATTD